MYSKQRMTVIPVIVPIPDHLRTLNFYLIEHSEGLTLIDAGYETEECWNRLCQSLDENGYSIHDIERIVLTHHHLDHIGLVKRIKKVKDVPVYAHKDSILRLKADQKFETMRAAFFARLYEEMGCGDKGRQFASESELFYKSGKFKLHGEIRPLTEGDTVAGLKVIECPGHSPDHIVLYDEDKNWLFGGDVLINHISSNAIVEPDYNAQRLHTVVQYVSSLHKLLKIEAKKIFPGHGEIIINHKELIQRRIDNIHKKALKFRKEIESRSITANELAMIFYKEKYDSQFQLVMSEIVGMLDYLEDKEMIRKELKNGIWYYNVETSV